MDKHLTWREIKALRQLYFDGSTRARIESRPYVGFPEIRPFENRV